ncbi:MAG: T9SS type A sorting domain-containing protein [Bacteroidia bacterium]|jgi:hypothetical protein|nr:T9SS type A sorting domain-containing protein [Bacteroidia bacterium]
MKQFIYTFVLLVFVTQSQAQWQTVTSSAFPPFTSMQQLYVDGTNFWAGTTGQLFRSTDNGATWEAKSNGLQSAISGNSGIVRLGNRLYASFSGNGNYFPYYSTDNGDNWVLDTAGFNGVTLAPVQLHVHQEYILARLESNIILYKKNTDAAWGRLTVPNDFRTPGYIYSIGDTLVLGAGYRALTGDMGQNWITRNTTLPAGFGLGYFAKLYQNQQDPETFYATYIPFATNRPSFFISRDNQTTWDTLSISLSYPTNMGCVWAKGNDVFLSIQGSFTQADTTQKVYRSNDGGVTWLNITGDLYEKANFRFHTMSDIEVVNGFLYGAGITLKEGGAMVKLNIGSVGLKETNTTSTPLFYPNPTTDFIQFDNQVNQAFVYNMQGQLVAQYNASQQPNISVSHLPAGMYWVQITLANQTYTQKIMKQ